MATDSPPNALDVAITERCVELRMELRDLAKAAGMSEAYLRRIRRGLSIPRDLKAAGLEDALQWEPGSVQAVLQGRPPTPRLIQRRAHKRTGRTLGEVLLERGLALPSELALSDDVIDDPVALEILDLPLDDAGRDGLLQAYANMRRAAYYAVQQKKKPRV
jgi:transcriptional regulator with XRE-family HTH domain